MIFLFDLQEEKITERNININKYLFIYIFIYHALMM